MLAMEIDSIRVSLMNYQRVVILKQKDTERYLPIWIGSFEADAIAMKLQDAQAPRPLTHDLLGSVIEGLQASVQHVVVFDLSNGTFYAKLVIDKGADKPLEVDCRPSDAIAIAVRSKVPIYVEDVVLEKAGILIDKDGEPVDPQDASAGPAAQPKELSAEEEQRLSAFSDFLKDLPGLEELGKRE